MVVAILSALATILGPILTAGVAVWLEKQHRQRAHETVEEVDAHIRAIQARHPAAYAELSQQLERLRREAQRKRPHHS